MRCVQSMYIMIFALYLECYNHVTTTIQFHEIAEVRFCVRIPEVRTRACAQAERGRWALYNPRRFASERLQVVVAALRGIYLSNVLQLRWKTWCYCRSPSFSQLQCCSACKASCQVKKRCYFSIFIQQFCYFYCIELKNWLHMSLSFLRRWIGCLGKFFLKWCAHAYLVYSYKVILFFNSKQQQDTTCKVYCEFTMGSIDRVLRVGERVSPFEDDPCTTYVCDVSPAKAH